MIFQATWKQVLAGGKTQTRRIIGPNDSGVCPPAYGGEITIVHIPGVRVKWRVGNTYAVQPGRGQEAVGRIRITRIRRERARDITEADALAEGCEYEQNAYGDVVTPVEVYRLLWDTIHTKRGERWADNPLVWVLEFELVEAA